MLRSVNIRLRLFLAFVLMSVLLALVGFVSFFSYKEVGSDVSQITAGSLVELEGAIDLKVSLYRGQVATHEMLAESYRLLGDTKDVGHIEKEIVAAKEEIRLSLEAFEEGVATIKDSIRTVAIDTEERGESEESDEEKRQLGEITELEGEYETYKINVLRFMEEVTVDVDKAEDFLDQELEPHFAGVLLPSIKEFREEEGIEIRYEGESIAGLVRNTSLFVGGVAIGSVVLSLVLGMMVTSSISIPIRELVRVSQDIAAGKSGSRVAVSGRDEISKLGTVFNQMADGLEKEKGGLVSQVDQSTQALNKKIEQLEKTNKTMVDRELKMTELKRELEELKTKTSL